MRTLSASPASLRFPLTRGIFLCILSIRHVRPKPISRASKQTKNIHIFMAESIENLHSISNFDNNPTTKGKRKYTTIERSSVCGVLGDLAKRLPATCRITDRSDCRFRQFIVHEMSSKRRVAKRAGTCEGGQIRK